MPNSSFHARSFHYPSALFIPWRSLSTCVAPAAWRIMLETTITTLLPTLTFFVQPFQRSKPIPILQCPGAIYYPDRSRSSTIKYGPKAQSTEYSPCQKHISFQTDFRTLHCNSSVVKKHLSLHWGWSTLFPENCCLRHLWGSAEVQPGPWVCSGCETGPAEPCALPAARMAQP